MKLRAIIGCLLAVCFLSATMHASDVHYVSIKKEHKKDDSLNLEPFIHEVSVYEFPVASPVFVSLVTVKYQSPVLDQRKRIKPLCRTYGNR